MKAPSFHLPFVKKLSDRLREKRVLIQVVLGPRQVGKTTGVLQCLEQLSSPYHYASSDDHIHATSHWIREQWQTAKLKDSRAILVLDEIQKVDQWSETIKALWDEQTKKKQPYLRVVLLGSSSLTIQKGLSESLAGRFELIQIPHWNYFETNQIKKMNLDQFLKFGGYPGSYPFIKDAVRWKSYVKDAIVDQVINKDILAFSHVRSPALFRQTFEILCRYPAQEISYNKLLGQLQDKGNTDLVKHYIELYSGAYLVATLSKYSAKPVLRKTSSPKILPLCPSLIHIAGHEDDKNESKGRLFEMIVGCELYRLSGDLYYWRDGGKEVDFIYQDGKKLYAIEVKSSRVKNKKGLDEFCKRFKKAIPVVMTPDHLPYLSQLGDQFFKQI